MRKLALALLLASSGAAVADTGITFSYDVKSNPKVEAGLKAETEKHRANLETAAAGKKPYEVHLAVTIEKKGTDTKCTVNVQLFSTKTMIAAIKGGAQTQGVDDRSADDCIAATIGDLLDKRVAQAITDNNKK